MAAAPRRARRCAAPDVARTRAARARRDDRRHRRRRHGRARLRALDAASRTRPRAVFRRERARAHGRPQHRQRDPRRLAPRRGVFGRPAELLRRGTMQIPAALVRLLLPLAWLVSLYFLLRGHNAPGGGVVGGLVLATGILTQYITRGPVWG